MGRLLAATFIAAGWIGQIGCSVAEAMATEPPPRSALIEKIVERLANDYNSFCFVGTHVSAKFKYRTFDLPPSFYERFVDGRFVGARINGFECPTEARRTSNCYYGCVTIQVFDMTDLGAPTPWTPWPRCAVEKISYLRDWGGITGTKIMLVNIHRQQVDHNYLTVIELAPCKYLIYDQKVIE